MTARAPMPLTSETLVFLGLGASLSVLLALKGPIDAGSAVALVLAVAVAIFGLPHGALDPWIARRIGLWHTRAGFAMFHLVYLALAATVILVWHWSPGASLVAFLAISAWHFAGDWRGQLSGVGRALVGSALIALPAWRWPEAVANAFVLLSGSQGAAIADVLASLAPFLAIAITASATMALRRSYATALELAAVAALAVLLPPLVYFIVYFCALHSLRHLRLATSGVAPSARRRMAGVAVLYTALSLLAAASVWPWLRDAGTHLWSEDLLRLVFIGLAALTLPHMLVVMLAERPSGNAR